MPNQGIKHIAIIMDGNGRWAKKRGLQRKEGHKAGSLTVKKIVKACLKLNIPYLTLYAISTENWTRPTTEIKALMNLLGEFISAERDNFHKNQIRLLVSGDISQFPSSLQKSINETVNLTKRNKKLIINIALNYGSRDELLRAVKQIALDYKNNKINMHTLNQKKFSHYLYHGEILPDPDILIRTSGEMRISNFLLWQIAYTELFFIKTLWPDFNEAKLKQIINQYHQRHRRYGGL